jgi:integrase
MSSLPVGVRKRGRFYYYRTRLNGRQKEIPLGSDLAMARQLAKQHAGKLAAIKGGLAHPDEAGWAEAESKPLAEHVHDWHTYLTSRGNVQRHCDQSRDRVLWLIEAAKVTRISGLTISAIQTALADLRLIPGRRGRQRMSDTNVAHYARAVKSFAKWLWKDKRVRDDPLVHMELPEVTDKMTRRAMEVEEIAALLATTPRLGRRAGLSGPDRMVVYSIALSTGYRLGELASLTPESFQLAEDPPTIFCAGKHCKNRKDSRQPIRLELATMLKDWLADKPPGEPVFPINRDDAALSLRMDLEAAGVDSAAEFDFHALRHTYVTLLVKSGASVKVCQTLARHADPKLTLNCYTHLTVHDLTQGLEILSHTIPTTGVLTGLTGTDGAGGGIATISSPGRTGAVPHGLSPLGEYKKTGLIRLVFLPGATVELELTLT